MMHFEIKVELHFWCLAVVLWPWQGKKKREEGLDLAEKRWGGEEKRREGRAILYKVLLSSLSLRLTQAHPFLLPLSPVSHSHQRELERETEPSTERKKKKQRRRWRGRCLDYWVKLQFIAWENYLSDIQFLINSTWTPG